MEDFLVPGSVVLLRTPQGEVTATYGTTELGVDNRPDADTHFRIASITKTFTAVAVMQLWEQGLVDLDAPANDYLRAFRLVPARDGWRPATVRHLLTHTAGVPKLVRPSRAVFSGWPGESVRLAHSVPGLGEFYGGRARVGRRRGGAAVAGGGGPAPRPPGGGCAALGAPAAARPGAPP